MKNKIWKKLLAACLVSTMAMGTIQVYATEADSDKPDTWIADRTITIQVYVNDIGYNLPSDLDATLVAQELKERTGISVEFKYTPGDSDSSVMAAHLASGEVADVVVGYLNNSTRKEFPIIKKAADEGLFADISEYLKDTEVYSKYYEEGYLPQDTYNNIVFREDFDGAVYFLHLCIDEEDTSMVWDPSEEYLGGFFIQQKIVDELGIDVTSIRTQEQLYDLLVQIKDAGFVDDNGNEMYPMGPRIWGGNADSVDYLTKNDNWGVSKGFNITEDGQVLHEAETDYVYDRINYVRSLIAEDLLHPEFFTIDETRAKELVNSKSVAIIADTHNYMTEIYSNEDWIPLGPLDDIVGYNGEYVSGKSGYGFAAISSEAENPEEIVQFLDYLSTYEGQLLVNYGIEGVTYNMVDGYPVLTDEAKEKIATGDTDWQINEIGAYFGGQGLYAFNFMLTNINNMKNFGETRPGAASDDNVYQRAVDIATEYERELTLLPGLGANAYLTTEGMEDVKTSYELLNYNEMLVQAIYANSDEDVVAIVESFRDQLKLAGIDEYYTLLEEMYAENPESIAFIPCN